MRTSRVMISDGEESSRLRVVCGNRLRQSGGCTRRRSPGWNRPALTSTTTGWEESFVSKFNVALKWNIEEIERCDDYNFIYFGVEDDLGNVLFRYDAPPQSPEGSLLHNQKEVTFTAATKPRKLIVWPVSHSRGWLKKLEYAL